MNNRRLVFQCLRCGNCCKNLMTPLKTGSRTISQGLCLFEEERSLFPASDILPMNGYGSDPLDEQFRVVAFQYTRDCCQFLVDGGCSIYDKRPFSCQSYPISPNAEPVALAGTGITAPYLFDPQCSWVKKYAPVDGKPYKVLALAEKFASSLILTKMTVLHKKYKGMLWLFDLSKEEWILSI